MGFPIYHLIKQRVAASVKQAATLVYFYSIFSNITRLFGVHNLCDNFMERGMQIVPYIYRISVFPKHPPMLYQSVLLYFDSS